MITPIAQKYASALMNVSGGQLDEIVISLQKIAKSCDVKKVQDILNSFTDKNNIISFFMDISGTSNKTLNNFLYVLESRNKLSLLPQISESLSLSQAKKNNKYIGYIYSKDSIKKDILSTLEKNISSKLEKNIELIYRKSDFKGVRVDIEMLNLEISFSQNQIKNKLLQHILKSI
jgi:F-type H+-transporting ATPase subunit delta